MEDSLIVYQQLTTGFILENTQYGPIDPLFFKDWLCVKFKENKLHLRCFLTDLFQAEDGSGTRKLGINPSKKQRVDEAYYL